MHAAIDAFLGALAARGIRPRAIKPDGNIHRCGTEKKPRSTNGAYCLHLDGDIPAGWFQNHEDGLGVERWHADKLSELTPAERLAWRRKIETQRRERARAEKARQEKTAKRARWIWERTEPVSPAHTYLRRKNIEGQGAREYRRLLVIPISSPDGEIVNLQFIATDGTKKFLSGGRKQGCYHAIGEPRAAANLIFIGEGYATMASVWNATDQLCVTAFDCGNLLPVARTWRRHLPDVRIVICADNDAPGRTAAEAVAQANENCIAVWPPREGDDFNDVNDPEEIRSLLRQALKRKTRCGADVG